MANKVPYEIVEVKVWELTELLVDKTTEEQFEILDQIDDWLTECGWTDIEFNYETLKRIDKNWYDQNLN